MTFKLPGWVKDNRTAVLEEAAPWRGQSPQRHAEALASACRTSVALLAHRPDAQRMWDWRDPLPQSSREALARLRREARSRRH